MKTYILLSIFSIWIAREVSAQPCKQIVINDSTQQKALTKYIDESVRHRSFVNDKGIVIVTRFTNESGRPSWLVKTVIDDLYKDNPPVEWASLGRDIVLFYDAKSSRFDVIKHDSTKELLNCLDEAIGDRLYIRPPKRDRWIEVPGLNGKTRKVNARRVYGGNTSNEQVFIFQSDGTVKVLQSV